MEGERDRRIPGGSEEARKQNPEKRLGEGDLEPRVGAGWEEGMKSPGVGVGRGRPRGLAGGTDEQLSLVVPLYRYWNPALRARS